MHEIGQTWTCTTREAEGLLNVLMGLRLVSFHLDRMPWSICMALTKHVNSLMEEEEIIVFYLFWI